MILKLYSGFSEECNIVLTLVSLLCLYVLSNKKPGRILELLKSYAEHVYVYVYVYVYCKE